VIVRELRVLMVAFHYAPGRDGLSRQTHRLARALVAQGVRVTAVTHRLPGAPAREDLDGVAVVRLPVPARGGFRTRAFPFISLLVPWMLRHRDQFDVVHAHQGLQPAAAAVAVARLLRKPSLVKFAGGGSSGNVAYLKRWRFTGGLSLRALRDATRLISLSEQVTAELLQEGFSSARIVEIPDGIEVERFAIPRATAGQQVMAAGRLSHEKGVDVLVAAWPGVVGAIPGATLTILGDGPEGPALRARAQALGVAGGIHFAGEVEDVRPFLGRSIFALPSRNEGMSNALLEAMAAGCPIVASDISPNRRLIQDGTNGRLFRAGDPLDLAGRLVELLGDPGRAQALGARAAAAAASYSIEEVAQRHRALYAEILSG
jgi:glycosyltransferase involved in cell wall biosynthesis